MITPPHASSAASASLPHPTIPSTIENPDTKGKARVVMRPLRLVMATSAVVEGASMQHAYQPREGGCAPYDLVYQGVDVISPVDGALYVSSDNASVLNGVESPEQGVIYHVALARSE